MGKIKDDDLCSNPPPTPTLSHTHTHMHACTHKYTHTHTHARTHTQVHTHTYITCQYLQTWTHLWNQWGSKMFVLSLCAWHATTVSKNIFWCTLYFLYFQYTAICKCIHVFIPFTLILKIRGSPWFQVCPLSKCRLSSECYPHTNHTHIHIITHTHTTHTYIHISAHTFFSTSFKCKWLLCARYSYLCR